jgi:hypothetical protein
LFNGIQQQGLSLSSELVEDLLGLLRELGLALGLLGRQVLLEARLRDYRLCARAPQQRHPNNKQGSAKGLLDEQTGKDGVPRDASCWPSCSAA